MSNPLSFPDRAAALGREQLSDPFTGKRVSHPVFVDVTSNFTSTSLLQSLRLCCHGLLQVLVDFYTVVQLPLPLGCPNPVLKACNPALFFFFSIFHPPISCDFQMKLASHVAKHYHLRSKSADFSRKVDIYKISTLQSCCLRS